MRASSHVALSVVFVCVLLAGCGGSKKEPDRYYHDTTGFSIQFPDGWMLREGDGVQASLVEGVSPWESEDDQFSEYVAVDVDELTGKVELEEYFNEYCTEQAAEFSNYEEIERGERTIGGKPAMYLLFEFGMEEGFNRALAFMLVKDKRAYLVSCLAEVSKFDDYRDTFEEAVSSFRIE